MKKSIRESVKEIPYDGDYEGSPLWAIKVESFGKCEDDVMDDLYTEISSQLDIYSIEEKGKTFEIILVNPSEKEKKWIIDYFSSKDWKNKESMYESKKENKIMKKSIRERFEAPKDWDFEEMISDYGMEYLGEHNPDEEPYSMDEFNELTNYRNDPLEAITRAFFGGRYGFKNDSFSPMDEWFAYDGAGNLISIKDYDIVEYLKDHIDEEYFYEWCVDNGYFEVEEDDE